MQVFDYTLYSDEEYDQLLASSEPCDECGEVETLALAIITRGDRFGSLLVFCAECNDLYGDEEFSVIEDAKIGRD